MIKTAVGLDEHVTDAYAATEYHFTYPLLSVAMKDMLLKSQKPKILPEYVKLWVESQCVWEICIIRFIFNIILWWIKRRRTAEHREAVSSVRSDIRIDGR